ncbi:hypothetical protein B0T17DRAFT_96784 [Bombardia bombarda]|uniref:Uncharacterized protein n=1 Tax=Bombardia bombarda TaxID=252184 RepID=A0AA40CG45_9PEZI|nr:hypothetical protein B0T17DRAFT_96784 [Bombardia bombarda]
MTLCYGFNPVATEIWVTIKVCARVLFACKTSMYIHFSFVLFFCVFSFLPHAWDPFFFVLSFLVIFPFPFILASRKANIMATGWLVGGFYIIGTRQESLGGKHILAGLSTARVVHACVFVYCSERDTAKKN